MIFLPYAIVWKVWREGEIKKKCAEFCSNPSVSKKDMCIEKRPHMNFLKAANYIPTLDNGLGKAAIVKPS